VFCIPYPVAHVNALVTVPFVAILHVKTLVPQAPQAVVPFEVVYELYPERHPVTEKVTVELDVTAVHAEALLPQGTQPAIPLIVSNTKLALQLVTVAVVADAAVQAAALGSAPYMLDDVQETHEPLNNEYPVLHRVFVTVVPFTVQVLALLPQAAHEVPFGPYPMLQVMQAVELQVAQLVPQAVQLPEAAVKMKPEPQADKILKLPPT